MKITSHPQKYSDKRAVVTRAKDDYDLARLTHPILDSYAERCGADFIVINEEIIRGGDYSYEIYQCYELFERYDRILSLDSDLLIAPGCPDLFAVVPADCIGTVFEDKFSRAPDRLSRIRRVQEKFGDVGWRSGYINTGAFICSKVHREIFAKPQSWWLDYGFDDVMLGYRIRQLGFKIYELSYRFNHMSLFSEVGRNHFTSYIIHYAGRGFSGKKSRFEQIKDDWSLLSENKNKIWLHFARPFDRLRLLAMGIRHYLRSLTASSA